VVIEDRGHQGTGAGRWSVRAHRLRGAVRALPDDRQLVGEHTGLRDAQPFRERAEPLVNPLLRADRALVGGQCVVGELRERHHAGASPEHLGPDVLGEGVEHGEDARARIRPGGGDRRVETSLRLFPRPRDVGGHQLVLRRERAVEHVGRDPGFGRDLVHARRADAVPVEEATRDVEDELPGLGRRPAHRGSPSCSVLVPHASVPTL
jgi:hypothetical protein